MRQTNLTQDSPEWHLARARCLTGSKDASVICAPKDIGKAGEAAMRSVVAHHYCNSVKSSFQNFAMQRGNDLQFEAEVLLLPHFEGWAKVNTLFAYHDERPYVGSSFDLLLKRWEDDYTHVEIKCPDDPAKHYDFLQMQTPHDLLKAEPKYFWQCIQQMEVIHCNTVYFCSYHPDFVEGKQLTLLEIKLSDVLEYTNLWDFRTHYANNYITNQLKQNES